MTVPSENRFKRGRPCPICGGCDNSERGEGTRCHGFVSADGSYAHCSREDRAGPLEVNANSGTYAHKLHGDCRCGVRHGEPEERRRGNGRGTVVATYDYTDEHGVVLFQAVRYVPKGFKQRRPDGRGGWIDNLKGVRRVLYKLPELLAADPGEVVYVCEGEKDVDNVRKLGLVSTCNPMGALKWHGVAELAAEALHGRPVVIIADKDRDGRTHAAQVAKALHGVAASVRVLELPGEDVKDASDWTGADPAHDAAALRAIADAAPEWEPAADVDPEPSTSRPTIQVDNDERRVVTEALEALTSEAELYERAGLLVHVMRGATGTPDGRVKRDAQAPRLAAVPLSWVEQYLSRRAKWLKFMGEDFGWRETRPPVWVARQVADAPCYPGLRSLTGVTTAPVLRRDGTILHVAGFDSETGLLFMPAGPVNPVPEQPTAGDALDAMDELLDAVCDFPFAAPEHRAAWLASLLTPFARWSFDGPTPLFFYDSNAPGAGKSKLATVTGIIAVGRAPSVMSWSTEPAECKKVITSLLLEAAPLVLIDNIEGQFGDAALKSLLTATTWRERILGVNKTTGDLPNLTTWYATANNVQLKGKDMPRRLIAIRLVSTLERPELRTGFTHDDPCSGLEGWVQTERPRLAAAALCILRAYHVAGRPDSGLPRGDYPGWCRAVRDPVVWLGLPDPTTTREGLRATADSDSAEHRALVAVLDGACSGRWLRASEILERVKTNEELRPLLLEHCHGAHPDELPDAKRLGWRLGRHLQAVIDGKRIVQSKEHGGFAVWRVEYVAGAA